MYVESINRKTVDEPSSRAGTEMQMQSMNMWTRGMVGDGEHEMNGRDIYTLP